MSETLPDNTEPKRPAPIPALPKERLQELLSKVGTNAALLEFPTDKWGFTSAIKKEVLKAASQVYGQDDKHDLLVGTIAVLMKHIQVRKDEDKRVRELRYQEQYQAAQDRITRDRLVASAVPAPVTE